MATFKTQTDAEKQLSLDCSKYGLDYGRAVGTIMSGTKLHVSKDITWTLVQGEQYVRTQWLNALCNYQSVRYSKHGDAVHPQYTSIG